VLMVERENRTNVDSTYSIRDLANYAALHHDIDGASNIQMYLVCSSSQAFIHSFNTHVDIVFKM